MLMVLAASLEFEKSHNSNIVERASDNVEVPQVCILSRYSKLLIVSSNVAEGEPDNNKAR